MKKTIKQNIVIIGGYGFIGKHLQTHLKHMKRFNNIYVVGKTQYKLIYNKNNSFHEKSIDHIELEKAFSTTQTVIYLAWSSTPYSSLSNDKINDNLSALKSYLKKTSHRKLKRFIFLSTAGALYKSETNEIFTELSNYSIQSKYAEEKLSAESLVKEALDKNCHVTTLRASNIYGPGQQFKLGMGLIPKLFGCAAEGKPIELYEPLSSQRDYLYIEDFISAIDFFISGLYPSGVYNLSSERNISLGALINNVEALVRKKIHKKVKLINAGNMSLINSNKMSTLTGWKAQVEIGNGLSMTWNWYNQ